MDAYVFISKCLDPLISSENFNQISTCELCGCHSITVEIKQDKTKSCGVCSLLQTPNELIFGMLTGVRAHSAISFLNSLIVVDEIEGLTLVVTEKYATQTTSTKYVKFVVYDINKYIIKLLNEPRKMVIIKPSIRYEDFAQYLMLSDERSVYVSSPKGGYCVNIDIWNELIVLVKLNDVAVISAALDFLIKIALGQLSNLDVGLREFVAKNHMLMVRFNELLSMDIHSRLFILNLLKVVCDDAIE